MNGGLSISFFSIRANGGNQMINYQWPYQYCVEGGGGGGGGDSC